MAIPDYQSFMVPLLQLASDQAEHEIGDAYSSLADGMGLTTDDRSELLPSGRQETYKNRIGWARTYLTKAGLLEHTKRGHFKITERGLKELQDSADRISTAYRDSPRTHKDQVGPFSSVSATLPGFHGRTHGITTVWSPTRVNPSTASCRTKGSMVVTNCRS